LNNLRSVVVGTALDVQAVLLISQDPVTAYHPPLTWMTRERHRANVLAVS